MSREKKLIEGLPEQRAPAAAGRGAPRYCHPERRRLGWHAAALDELIAPDHPVRAAWVFAQALDLRALHDRVKAREGCRGSRRRRPS